MYKTFLEIYILLLCVNGMILTGEALLGPMGDDLLSGQSPIGTPFDVNTDLTVSNATLALTAPDSDFNTNMNTTSATNPLNTIGDPYGMNVIWALVGVVTGEGVWDMLSAFGFPEIFIWVVRGIMGLFAGLTLLYFFTGKST